MTQKGYKLAEGKRRWDLMPFEALEPVVDILEKALDKYPVDNWKYVPNAQESYLPALFRHWHKRNKGAVIDPEYGLPHMAHLICDALFILWHDMQDTAVSVPVITTDTVTDTVVDYDMAQEA